MMKALQRKHISGVPNDRRAEAAATPAPSATEGAGMNGDTPRKRRPCRCRTCRLHQEVRRVLESCDFQQSAKMIRLLANDLCCAEEDASYYRCILDGSWPSAVEQLTAALERAKVKRLEDECT